jgi:apolipoprotein N-acyltransferase
VPFGEYVPYEGMIPWPAWIGGHGYDTTPGSGPQLFTLQNGTPFATLICWESVFSGLSREAVAGGARLLVQLNNPVSFGHTAAGKQQNLSSVLRAVENRVPVLLASNTGPSQIIDSYGRVVTHTTEIFAAGMIAGDVPLGSGGTPYTKAGDLFVLGMFSALAFGALLRRSAFVSKGASAILLTPGEMVSRTRSQPKELA